MIKLKQWNDYLKSSNYSKNTQVNYYSIIKTYSKSHTTISKNLMLLYKEEIKGKYKPASVNLKLRALNEYNKVINKSNDHVSGVKLSKKTCVDNIITRQEYSKLLNYLQDHDLELYYIVRVLSNTGMRISETLSISIEDIKLGCFDVIGKGNKLRQIYVPETLQKELVEYYKNKDILWDLNANQIRYKLTKIAEIIKVNKKHVHSHAFRHYYALRFLERCPDIALLADLMGHSNIETTRIYLRKSSEEQRKMINKIVSW